jgi:CubicO group peptidase (beta-lactamase class C family)
MGRLDGIKRWLDEEFAGLVASSEVPGAAVAVLAGDEVAEQAAGVLNLRTGVEATTDSVFQIGSITKLWTATLVMQLVDDGLLDLDEPVRTYLPGFRVADELASARITSRQLLAHTSGIEGDEYTEVSRGDDVLERFCAEILPDLPLIFPPGERFSYCNTGYTVLGRLIEVLRGRPYNDVVLDKLAKPLGLRTVSPRADDAILHRAAVGHQRSDGEWKPASVWAQGFARQPCGSMLAMSARDLIEFARMHQSDGRAFDGTQVLAEQSVQAMRESHVRMPGPDETAVHRALGWTLEKWSGGNVIGHDGGTIGQGAFFRVAPEHDVAVALLTNGGRMGTLFSAVFGHVLTELAGIGMPADPEPPEHPEPVDPRRYAGRYESPATRFDIEADTDGELRCELRMLGEYADMMRQTEPERDRIVRLDGDTFVFDRMRITITFVGDDGTGRARYLHIGRAVPRVG